MLLNLVFFPPISILIFQFLGHFFPFYVVSSTIYVSFENVFFKITRAIIPERQMSKAATFERLFFFLPLSRRDSVKYFCVLMFAAWRDTYKLVCL